MSQGLATLPDDFKPTSFWAATAVTPHKTDNNRYVVDIKRDWCIGIGKSKNITRAFIILISEQFQMEAI